MTRSKKTSSPAANASAPDQGVERTTAVAVDFARPRDGTRPALLLDLLSRREGASVPEVMERTGWLPHTTRAALTGLRRRGYAVLREPDGEGVSRYRIEVEAPKPARKARGRRAAPAGDTAPTP